MDKGWNSEKCERQRERERERERKTKMVDKIKGRELRIGIKRKEGSWHGKIKS